MWVNVKTAAEILSVSEDTIKRRIKNKAVTCRQEETRFGWRWLIEVPDAPGTAPPSGVEQGEEQSPPQEERLATLEHLVAQLEQTQAQLWHQLESREREVSELHVLLQRALESRAPVYLPAPTTPLEISKTDALLRRKSWWQFWKGNNTAGAEETVSTAS